MSLMYYKPIKDGSAVYSCDGLRINFDLNPAKGPDAVDFLADVCRPDISSFPDCFTAFKFRKLFQISYLVDNEPHKMTIGLGFNGAGDRSDAFKGYIDVNPNKCACPRFFADLTALKGFCKHWDIVRCDIALDIPVERSNVILVKDSRKYALDAYSLENKTEYLGRRSNVGFVKVYNKQEEAGTASPLTRIEVTCEPSLESYIKAFPRVYDITAGGQLSLDIMKLNQTDLALLRLCLSAMASGSDAGLMFFNSLARCKKEKIRPFLLPDSSLVRYSSDSLRALFGSVLEMYAL